MNSKRALGLGLVTTGAGLIKHQLDEGNLDGRELVYHNTNKKNIENIRKKGILKTRSYDKDNITHKGLKGSVKVKDMGGLTYVGRNIFPALGVGSASALYDSKNEDSVNYKHLAKALSERSTLRAKIPSWKMQMTDNPELMGTKNGKEYRDIVLNRYKKRTGKEATLSRKINARISAEIMHKNLNKKNTHTIKESIKPQYIIGSDKYRNADKDEIRDYINNNPKRFTKGITLSGLGLGMTGTGAVLLGKSLKKVAMEKQASNRNIPLSLLGAGLVMNSRNLLEGKKTLYQGTSNDNWNKIKSDGIKSSYGGTGASKAVGNSAFQQNSRGKVHLTAIRPIANSYAAVNTDEISKKKQDIADFKERAFNIQVQQLKPGVNKIDYKLKRGHHKDKVDKVKAMENDLRELNIQQRNNPINTLIDPSIMTNGKTIKVKLDYNKWKNDMQQDREGTPLKNVTRKIRGDNNAIIKHLAAKGEIDIPIENITGSNAKLSDKAKHTLNELPSYIKENPLRFGSGVASAGLGAYLLKKGLIR